MIAGLEAPDGGEIRFNETIVAGDGTFLPPEKRGIGMVFQSYALYPHMTVAENMGYGLKVNGVPKEITITQANIAEALSEPIGAIVEGVRIALENTAPELAADIVDQGIVLTGGGALIQGLDEHLREETGLPVSIAEDPLSCVAIGTGRAMEDPIYRGVLMTA